MWTATCERKPGRGHRVLRALGITLNGERFSTLGRPCCGDDQNFYVGFWLEDRDVCGAQGEDPLLVWQDNNAGVLLVGREVYYELAVNPLGATSEMFHIWKEAYQRGDRYDVPEFDLAVHRPEVLGGGIEFRLSRHALGFFALAFSRITGRGAGRGHPE